MDERTESLLQTLQRLPVHEVELASGNQSGRPARVYRGALLYDYSRAAGMVPKPPSIGFGNYYFVVRAEDGFTVTLAYFEVTPRATSKRVLLAWEEDGRPLSAGVRLVVSGDQLGGRSIRGVVEIELRSVPSAQPQDSRRRPDCLVVGGLVEHPAKLSHSDLASFPRREVVTPATRRHGGVMVPPRRYSGVLLWDILAAARPKTDPAVNEDILRKAVVLRSTDGYSAVIAAGEIEPRFMAGQVLVATEVEGRPLPEGDACFRLVVPYDKAVGRSIKGLDSIEVITS